MLSETIGFFPIQILKFQMLRNNADVHISSLGYLWGHVNWKERGKPLVNVQN